MNIDRRCFIAMTVGGAAGTALTPIPWKLMDDVSIWSQNWPWTPVPPEGEFSEIATVCTLCPGGCGISVRKVNQRVIKVEGLEDHPVNQGAICIRGLSGPQLLYHPARIHGPLKRVGERGDGRWEKISWAEAIAEVVGRLETLQSENRAPSVAGVTDSVQGTVGRLLERFLTAYGSSRLAIMADAQDTAAAGLAYMTGQAANIGYDLQNADLVMGFGAGILDGWGSPVWAFQAHSAWETEGIRLVQAEPRLSRTAACAEQWLPVRPGTYGALALGLARTVLERGGEDRAFLPGTSGFEEWKQGVLENFGTSRVAEITGVEEDRIRQAGKAFAEARKPLALWGEGRGLTPGTLQDFMAVMALNALKGNLNRPGGAWTVPPLDYIPWVGGQEEKAMPEGADALLASLAQGDSGGVELLLVHQANPAYSLPATDQVRAALAQIPTLVSFASFMDETAQLADLILPNHLYLERFEDVPVRAGLPRPIVGLCRPVVAPQHNTRHVGDTLLQIAQALGGPVAEALPWDNYEACLRETLGNQWDTLMETTYWQVPTYGRGVDFSFVADGGALMPDYHSVESEGDAAEYPLELIPYDTMRLAAGWMGSMPYMLKTVEDTVLMKNSSLVEINPETAQAQNLKEGQEALLTTPVGQARVKVHLSHGIRPGLLALPRGLGHMAYDEFLKGKGVNVNALMKPVADPVTGLNAAWGIRAKLSKV
ncbi:MAG: menaquinone reductase molybdopterin-binding-like subunit QrcB [Desulfobacterales bacterium]